MVYWYNSYTIVHFSLDIIEWFKYKLKNVFKLYLILIHPPLSINTNFRAWKTRIDLILSKNKVLDIVKGKEKEPWNVAVMEKFKDSDINAMSIIVESIKDHLIPYISHLDSSKKMYDALTNLFSVRNIGQVMSLKNELRDMNE